MKGLLKKSKEHNYKSTNLDVLEYFKNLLVK